jgi:hypothetical protein
MLGRSVVFSRACELIPMDQMHALCDPICDPYSLRRYFHFGEHLPCCLFVYVPFTTVCLDSKELLRTERGAIQDQLQNLDCPSGSSSSPRFPQCLMRTSDVAIYRNTIPNTILDNVSPA